MKKYCKLFLILTRAHFIRDIAYRPSFVLALVGKFFRLGIFMLYADAIFRNVPALAGWTRASIPLLVFTLYVVEMMTGFAFHRNLLYYFARMLKSGQYDFVLVQPVNPIFLTAFAEIDTFDMIVLAVVLVIFAVYLAMQHIAALTLAGYVLLIVCANFILFSFALMLSALNFRTIITTGLGRMYESIGRLNRFPLDVLPKFWRVALFYVVPIAVAANIPAKFLIGTWSWWQLLYIACFAVVIFVVAVKLWYRALRHYSSVA